MCRLAVIVREQLDCILKRAVLAFGGALKNDKLLTGRIDAVKAFASRRKGKDILDCRQGVEDVHKQLRSEILYVWHLDGYLVNYLGLFLVY
jgi:hypothetical protein